ncbi:type II toxin-antitoxin system VapC family toxin [Acidobacteria bacterium AH-259-D05]|nr:type II toxin-antitoxin system VapC family toxin [Acidobacteria bacterium AH-259-D05]
MTKAAVDSSIILDVLLDDPEFGQRSLTLLEKYFARGLLVICPVAFAESAACLAPPSRFIEVSLGMNLSYEDFDSEVCVLAAEMWRQYRSRGGSKRRVLADFLIGAHAQFRADLLLTRDRGFYRTYFQDLKVLEP